MRVVPRSYKEENRGNHVSSARETVKKSVGSEPPFREDLIAEAEEFPVLEVVTRERLVKAQQIGKHLAHALVTCKAWILAMALQLLCSSESCCKVVNKSNIQSKNPIKNHS
jgi:hypothetical protein